MWRRLTEMQLCSRYRQRLQWRHAVRHVLIWLDWGRPGPLWHRHPLPWNRFWHVWDFGQDAGAQTPLMRSPSRISNTGLKNYPLAHNSPPDTRKGTRLHKWWESGMRQTARSVIFWGGGGAGAAGDGRPMWARAQVIQASRRADGADTRPVYSLLKVS